MHQSISLIFNETRFMNYLVQLLQVVHDEL